MNYSRNTMQITTYPLNEFICFVVLLISGTSQFKVSKQSNV